MRRMLVCMIASSVLFALQANAFQDPTKDKEYMDAIERLGVLEEINVTAYKAPKEDSATVDPEVKALLEEAKKAEEED